MKFIWGCHNLIPSEEMRKLFFSVSQAFPLNLLPFPFSFFPDSFPPLWALNLIQRDHKINTNSRDCSPKNEGKEKNKKAIKSSVKMNGKSVSCQHLHSEGLWFMGNLPRFDRTKPRGVEIWVYPKRSLRNKREPSLKLADSHNIDIPSRNPSRGPWNQYTRSSSASRKKFKQKWNF